MGYWRIFSKRLLLIFFQTFIIVRPPMDTALGYKYLGCYIDKAKRALTGSRKTNYKALTTEICVKKCAQDGFRYAATEYRRECFCGNSYNKYGKSPKRCDMRCNGNKKQICGGAWKISVYKIYKCKMACPKIYKPVCASNGRTYPSACNVRVAACLSGKRITIRKTGRCTNCARVRCARIRCPPGYISKTKKGQCCPGCVTSKCNIMCPMIYKPVCASNGKTYSNKCAMKAASCKIGKTLTVRKPGRCTAIPSPPGPPNPNAPVLTSKPKITIEEQKDSTYVFVCSFVPVKENGISYTVTWYCGEDRVQQVLSGKKPTAKLTAGKLKKCKLGDVVYAEVIACKKAKCESTKSPPYRTNKYPTLIKISTTKITVHEGGSSKFITLKSTVPPGFFCYDDSPDVWRSCYIEVSGKFVLQTRFKSCGVPVYQAVCSKEDGPCAVRVTSKNWETGLKLYIKAVMDGLRDRVQTTTLRLSATVYREKQRISTLQKFTSIRVTANDFQTRSSMCNSVNDPHMRSFDGSRYNHFLRGQFTLYKHKTLQQEVQVKYKSCNGFATCNVAVAVRSGNDVIVLDRSSNDNRKRKGYIPLRKQAYVVGDWTPGTRIIEKNGGREYVVILPTGTSVRVIYHDTRGRSFLNVWVKATSADYGKTVGLCGTYDGSRKDDFTLKTGKIGSKKVFNENWRVRGATLFDGYCPNENEKVVVDEREYCKSVEGSPASCSKFKDVLDCVGNGKDVTYQFLRSAKEPVKCMVDEAAEATEEETPTEEKEPTFPTKTGITEKDATRRCTIEIKKHLKKTNCHKYLKRNQIAAGIHNCKADIRATSSFDWVKASTQNLEEQCLEEVKEDPDRMINGEPDPDVVDNICIDDCNDHGVCRKRKCVCEKGYEGENCEFKKGRPPILGQATIYCKSRRVQRRQRMWRLSKLYKRARRWWRRRGRKQKLRRQLQACQRVKIQGNGFVRSSKLTCHITELKDGNKSSRKYTVKAKYHTFDQVSCVLKRPVSAKIEISNHENFKSLPLTYLVYDDACQKCSKGRCFTRKDVCFINKKCYVAGSLSKTNSKVMCVPKVNAKGWTSIRTEVKRVVTITLTFYRWISGQIRTSIGTFIPSGRPRVIVDKVYGKCLKFDGKSFLTLTTSKGVGCLMDSSKCSSLGFYVEITLKVLRLTNGMTILTSGGDQKRYTGIAIVYRRGRLVVSYSTVETLWTLAMRVRRRDFKTVFYKLGISWSRVHGITLLINGKFVSNRYHVIKRGGKAKTGGKLRIGGPLDRTPGRKVRMILVQIVFYSVEWRYWREIQIVGHRTSYVLHQGRMTWEDAKRTCKKNKSQLVMLKNRSEQRNFERLVKGKWKGRVKTDLWMGLSNVKPSTILRTPSYRWVDNTRLAFKNWDSKGKEPNALRTDHCIRIRTSTTFGKWRTMKCSNKYQFVCEKRTGHQTQPPAPPPSPSPAKVPGYLGCYKDRKLRALRNSNKMNYRKLTPKICILKCRREGFRYAGLEYARECFCGNKFYNYGKLADKSCSTNCIGSSGYKCGGTWKISVYKTGYKPRPRPRPIPPAPPKVPGYLGCYKDRKLRALRNSNKMNYRKLTPKICILKCRREGFRYAGLEFAKECFCGNKFYKYGKLADKSCSTNCIGSSGYKCGGTWKISVYITGYKPRPRPRPLPPAPSPPKVPGYLGCYKDRKLRALRNSNKMNYRKLTPKICISKCRREGFRYAGLEYARECFCGNKFYNYGKLADKSCSTNCIGSSGYKCGGTWKISVYKTGYKPRPRPRPIPPAPPKVPGYLGCYKDRKLRALRNSNKMNYRKLTPKICILKCRREGFRYAGLEFAKECFCGNKFYKYGKLADKSCSTNCIGSSGYKCGGTWKISVYITGYKPRPRPRPLPPAPSPPKVPGYLGCYKDRELRALRNSNKMNYRKLTPKICILKCRREGFRYAGLEFAKECFCGNKFYNYGKLADKSCSTNCIGSSGYKCGGTWKISVYKTGYKPRPRPRPIPPAPPKVPGYLGCYKDRKLRALRNSNKMNYRKLTPKICISKCRREGFRYAGLEFAKECFCGNKFYKYGKLADKSCSTNCIGSSGYKCGGTWKISVYKTGYKPRPRPRPLPPAPSPPKVPGYLGCYKDRKLRALRNSNKMNYRKLTPKICISKCRREGFGYAGLEYARECFCGNKFYNYGKLADKSCSTNCIGSSGYKCGGTWKISVYKTGYKPRPRPRPIPPAPPKVPGYLGCYKDRKLRALRNSNKMNYRKLTPKICISKCRREGFQYAGLEYARECFCGNKFYNYGKLADKSCSTNCIGSSGYKCGGTWKISVYKTGYKPRPRPRPIPPAPPKVPGYLGCYKDRKLRALRNSNKMNYRKLTPKICILKCRREGFRYAGLEYARECFCGNKFYNYGKLADKSCSTNCIGSSGYKCGGTWKISVYKTGYKPRPRPRPIPPAPPKVPGYLGCYKDRKLRALRNSNKMNYRKLTPKICILKCRREGFQYAGLEYARECFCGNKFYNYGKLADKSCSTNCIGSSGYKCGGTWKISVYKTGYKPRPRPRPIPPAPPKVPGYLGCYKDRKLRALRNSNKMNYRKLTPKICILKCRREGFQYAGLEYARECFCGNKFYNYGKLSDKSCSTNCIGSSGYKCGGTWKISVYKTGYKPRPRPRPIPPAPPKVPGYLGCYKDRKLRALRNSNKMNYRKLTPKICILKCRREGFQYAGLEYARECFCGNKFYNYGKLADKSCSTNCIGSSGYKCGGTWKISVYKTGYKPRPRPIPPAPPKVPGYLGCYKDRKLRALRNSNKMNYRKLTPKICILKCRREGFRYAGLEYARECFCGNKFYNYGKLADKSCSTNCIGSSGYKCGGTWKISVYKTGRVKPCV